MPSRPFRNPANYAALLFPLVAVVENKLLPVVMLGMLAATAVVAWPWKLRFWTPLLVGFGLLLGWSLLSAAWSLDPGHSLSRFGRLALTVAAGLLLCRFAASSRTDERLDTARWLSAGLLIAGAVVFLREAWLRLAPPDSLPDIVYWLSVLPYSAIAVPCVFLLLATLTDRAFPPLTLAAIAAALATTAVAGSGASMVALAVGATAYAVVLWLGRPAVRVMAVALPILFLAAPLSVGPLDLPSRLAAQGMTVDNSTAHRMVIWRYVTGKIREAPVLGWGLHAARLLSDREGSANDDPRYADIFAIAPNSSSAAFERMPMHPHNATLQLVLELGAVGGALYAALFAISLLALLRAPLPQGALAGGAGLIATLFAIGQLSFSVWQSWWLCAQFMAAALYLAVAWRREASPAPG